MFKSRNASIHKGKFDLHIIFNKGIMKAGNVLV